MNITYTDYRNNKLYNQIIKYNVNNENKTNETIFNHDTICNSYVKTDKPYSVCDKVIEYISSNGNLNYRIDIQPQFKRKKSKKTSDMEKIINIVCNTLYINVLTDGSIPSSMSIMIDESKIRIDSSISLPDISVSVNIYDNIGIFDMIKLYQINKL